MRASTILRTLVPAGLVAVLLAACDSRPTVLAHPFYLTYPEDPDDMALYRCPEGPGEGCAGDELPGPQVFAGGADKRYVVVARHPRTDGVTDPGRTEYFYFARVPEETAGWGNNPEKIVGPLSEAEFKDASRRLGLPPLSVRVH